jgi:hypothetical protein
MPKSSITRRSFAKTAAAAATVALINPAEALSRNDQAKTDTPVSQKAHAALAKLSAPSRAEVEMKVNEIFRKYGDRLNDEQKADILRIMAEGQPSLEKMRAFALENGDQPATIFHPVLEAKPAIRGKGEK